MSFEKTTLISIEKRFTVATVDKQRMLKSTQKLIAKLFKYAKIASIEIRQQFCSFASLLHVERANRATVDKVDCKKPKQK